MNYPKYVRVEDKEYKINTDFRVAIECNRVAEDETIGDFERVLAIIYLLYGEEGINTPSHYEKLLELAKKYLSCGKEIDNNSNEQPDMDFIEDMDYIEASFMSDYHIDLSNINMHWWKFSNLMNGLSNSELGNCCVLNKIRNARTYDASQIKDTKERDKFIQFQKSIQLEKYKRENHLTKEQEESMNKLNEMLGL